MISASKTTFSLYNLKISRPRVTKILQICLRSFVNFDPVEQKCPKVYAMEKNIG